MFYPRDPHDIDPTTFAGYSDARRLIFDHEDCMRTVSVLQATELFDDLGIAAVHVTSPQRADRIQLAAYDVIGRVIEHEVLYVDDPTQQLSVCPRFDHAFTRLHVTEGSALADVIRAESGWVIDMEAVRAFDVLRERQNTERAMFLALAGDMVRGGQLRTLFPGLGEAAGFDAA